MAFQGSLKELPLPDIIQLVAVSRKSGVFSIEEKGHRGFIVLRDGEIIHAEAGDLRGEEALYELAIWPEGRFQFDPDEKPGATGSASVTIDKSNTNLLMEAARRIDEWRILSKKIPSIRMVPIRTGVGSASLNPREAALLGEVDDRRTIESIALALRASPFEIAKQTYGLVTAGAVRLRDEAPWLASSSTARLSPEQAASLAAAVRDETAGLGLSHGAREEIDRRAGFVRQAADQAAAAAALTILVRHARQLISSELGSEEAGKFFVRVEQLFEAV